MQDLLSRVTVWYLREAYTQVLSEVKGQPRTVERLERAYRILISKDAEYSIELVKRNPATFKVVGPNDSYTVVGRECTCPDGEVLCKHRLAVRLLTTAGRLQRAGGVETNLPALLADSTEPAMAK